MKRMEIGHLFLNVLPWTKGQVGKLELRTSQVLIYLEQSTSTISEKVCFSTKQVVTSV